MTMNLNLTNHPVLRPCFYFNLLSKWMSLIQYSDLAFISTFYQSGLAWSSTQALLLFQPFIKVDELDPVLRPCFYFNIYQSGWAWSSNQALLLFQSFIKVDELDPVLRPCFYFNLLSKWMSLIQYSGLAFILTFYQSGWAWSSTQALLFF